MEGIAERGLSTAAPAAEVSRGLLQRLQSRLVRPPAAAARPARRRRRRPRCRTGFSFRRWWRGSPACSRNGSGPTARRSIPAMIPRCRSTSRGRMFDAIKDASADPPVDFHRADSTPSTPEAPRRRRRRPCRASISSPGPAANCRRSWPSMGVPFDDLKPSGTPQVLFIDGIHPPDAVGEAGNECRARRRRDGRGLGRERRTRCRNSTRCFPRRWN